jgi:hypothetical protein
LTNNLRRSIFLAVRYLTISTKEDDMGALTPFDVEVIEQLRDAHVMQTMNGNKLDLSRGVIVIRCPDGDQMLDSIEHDRHVAIEAGVTPRIHLLTCHGGCMAIAPNSPLYPNMGIDAFLLKEIEEAEALKEIHVISAEIHVPCGKAKVCGLTLVHQIVLQMAAKPRIKAVDPTNKVMCRIHVDHGNRKRTYFISRQKWIAFWNQRGRVLWGHLFQSDPYPRAQTPSDRLMAPPTVPEVLAEPTVVPGTGEGSALSQLLAGRSGTSDTQLAIDDASRSS